MKMNNAIDLLEEVATKMESCGGCTCSNTDLVLLTAALSGAIEVVEDVPVSEWPVVGSDVYVSGGQPVAADLHLECLRQSLALSTLSEALSKT